MRFRYIAARCSGQSILVLIANPSTENLAIGLEGLSVLDGPLIEQRRVILEHQ